MKRNKLTTVADLLISITAYLIFLINYFEVRGVIFLDDKLLKNIFLKNLEPIEGIELGRNYCREKENYFQLVNYTFFGITKNCYDRETNTFLDKYPCPHKKDSEIEIKEIEQKALSRWRDKNICIKRMAQTKNKKGDLKFYLQHYLYPCLDNYKKCGLINTDSNGQCEFLENSCKSLCVLRKNDDGTENKCPINFMTITNDISDYDGNYTAKPLDNLYYLVYSNNMTEKPVPIDFKISEGKYPCLEVERRSYNFPPFPLIKNYKYFNCNRVDFDAKPGDEGYDTRYKKIDKLEKDHFFSDNFLDMEYRTLPNLEGKNYNWTNDIDSAYFSIFYRDYYTDKENCGTFESFSNKLKKLKKLQLIKLATSLITLIVLIVIISTLSLVKGISEIRYSIFFFIKILLCYVYSGIYIYLINGKIMKKHKGLFPAIETFVDVLNPCFDSVMKNVFRRYDLKNDVHKTKKYFQLEFYSCIVFMLFSSLLAGRFIHKIYVRIKNKTRREIAIREIGNEQLQEIFQKYRSKTKRKNSN